MQLRDNSIHTPVSPPPPAKWGTEMTLLRRLPALLLALAVVALAMLLSGGPALAQGPVDYDTDDDNLIEIANLDQLNAMRWDLDGDGAASTGNEASYAAAFPNAASGMGCTATCTGYELTADLDFDTDGDGYITGNDAYYNNGAGWDPIRGWTATFDGGYHTISNLFINRGGGQTALFGRIEAGSVIRNVGLPNVDITVAGDKVGALVGLAQGGGLIEKSFATGAIKATPRKVNRDYYGGLVGQLTGGTMRASWANVTVRGSDYIGGLVGALDGGANVVASYSLGTVISRGASGDQNAADRQGRHVYVGGVYGTIFDSNSNTVNTYFDQNVDVQMWYTHPDVDGNPNRSVGYAETARPTDQMQNPVGYTGIYANWNLDLDGDGTADDPWDFGTESQYPALKGDSDGVFTWQEFGDQGRVDRPDVKIATAQAAINEGQTARFTIVINPAPTEAVSVNVHVQGGGGGDYGVANGVVTVTIPANRRSVPYTVDTMGDSTDERSGWVQLALRPGTGYDWSPSLVRVNINDNDLPAAVAGVYTPRLPQVAASLDGAGARTSRNVSRPGTFSVHVVPDNSAKAQADKLAFGETPEYRDYHASLKYKWDQVSGPAALGPPLLGGCEKRGGESYCTYSLYSAEQPLSWNVWDGVAKPQALRDVRPMGASQPGDYLFRLTVRDPATGDEYTAPQAVTVNVADETGAVSAPTATGRVTTQSPHPQSSYTVIEAGKGPRRRVRHQ